MVHHARPAQPGRCQAWQVPKSWQADVLAETGAALMNTQLGSVTHAALHADTDMEPTSRQFGGWQ